MSEDEYDKLDIDQLSSFKSERTSPAVDESRTFNFTLHSHYKDGIPHLDLRCELNDFLQTYTISDLNTTGTQPTGESTLHNPVFMFANVEKLAQLIPHSEPGVKYLATLKPPQPKIWLNVQGTIPPNSPGSTPTNTGVLQILDQGTIEWGAQKSYFQEFYLKGSVLSGHFAYITLPTKVQPFEDGQPPTSTEATFSLIQQLDPSTGPYVLSDRAVTSKYIPPFHVSALSSDTRAKVPLRYRYWLSSDEGTRLAMRDSFIEEIKAGTITLSDNTPIFKQTNFILQHHIWKGSVDHYDLILNNKLYILNDNPVTGTANMLERSDLSPQYQQIYATPISLSKQTPENPTAYSAQLVTVDNGSAIIFEDGPTYKQFELSGSLLNGMYTFRRSTPNSVGELQKLVQLSDDTSTDSSDTMLMQMGINVNGIRKTNNGWIVPGVALSHGVWNGNYYGPQVISDRPERILTALVDVEHNQKSVGHVLSYKFNGDEISVDTFIEQESLVNDIIDGKYNGYSVEINTKGDHVRKVVKEILAYNFVSLVKYPACALCVLGGKKVK
jgi:hypothetical protein